MGITMRALILCAYIVVYNMCYDYTRTRLMRALWYPMYTMVQNTKMYQKIKPFLRNKGLPTDVDCATATVVTTAPNQPSFETIGPKLAEFELWNRPHWETSSAIARSRGPQNTSAYVKNWYKNSTTPKSNSTIPKTNTIDKKVLYKCKSASGTKFCPIYTQLPLVGVR